MSKTERRPRIATLGECMIELREAGAALTSAFAGDTLNVATYLRRLLPAADYDVDYISALGNDHLSARMLDAWKSEGIGTQLVRNHPRALPGLYWIQTDAAGEREFLYWRNASAARNVLAGGHDRKIRESLTAGDVLFLSGISFAILAPAQREKLLALLADFHEHGVRIAYDSNYRRRLWRRIAVARRVQKRLLRYVHTFITSYADEAALFGDHDLTTTAERLAAAGTTEWVIRGDPGETLASNGSHSAVGVVSASCVVDTTGAGDSFDAAYLAARLSGYEVPAAIRAGHKLAALVVRCRGAIIDRAVMPALSELVRE